MIETARQTAIAVAAHAAALSAAGTATLLLAERALAARADRRPGRVLAGWALAAAAALVVLAGVTVMSARQLL